MIWENSCNILTFEFKGPKYKAVIGRSLKQTRFSFALWKGGIYKIADKNMRNEAAPPKQWTSIIIYFVNMNICVCVCMYVCVFVFVLVCVCMCIVCASFLYVCGIMEIIRLPLYNLKIWSKCVNYFIIVWEYFTYLLIEINRKFVWGKDVISHFLLCWPFPPSLSLSLSLNWKVWISVNIYL